ncbi:hypothetical protein ACU4GD_28165 [Cupriavidus basilensis]
MPANTAYLPIVARKSVAPVEKLALDGIRWASHRRGRHLSTSAFVLDNNDGALDGWLSDVWVNRPVRVFIGRRALGPGRLLQDLRRHCG